MSRVLLKSRSDIVDDLINAVVARTPLSDVNDASVMRRILLAVADEIFTVYGQFTNLAALFDFQKAEGADLDERAKEILGGTLTRTGSARAVGSLTFTRQTTGTVVSIPSGTICATQDGVQFETTAVGSILSAATSSGPIAARAINTGLEGNVSAGTVVVLVNKPIGVNTVSNTANFSGGAAVESDEDFRARIQNFVQSLARCTVDGIEGALFGVEDTTSGKKVRYVHVFEPVTNPGTAVAYIDDGANTAASTTSVTGETVIAAALGGEEFLYTDNKPLLDNLQDSSFEVRKNGTALVLGTDYYVNWASGRIYFTTPLSVGDAITADYQYYTGLVALAQKVVDGDPADRVNFPGYRAAGVDVRVLTPTAVNQPVTANIALLEGFNRTTVLAQAQSNVVAYINALGISGDVIRAEIIERIMATPGVYNVNVTQPAADVVINDDQLVRTTTTQVSIT